MFLLFLCDLPSFFRISCFQIRLAMNDFIFVVDTGTYTLWYLYSKNIIIIHAVPKKSNT
jgi:hypothetical protein